MDDSLAPGGGPRAGAIITVGVGDAEISNDPEAVLVTHALGSCLGIILHDPVAVLAGLFHPMLPQARECTDRVREKPFTCVDTGFPLFLDWMLRSGADQKRLTVRVAGGAQMFDVGQPEHLGIGKRNMVMLRRLLWKAGLLIKAECTGGTQAQTVRIAVGTGRVVVSTAGVEREL